MLFNSYIFVFIFLPLVLLGWYGLNRFGKHKTAKIFLIGMSLWFYGYFNVYYLFIIVASILINYFISYLLTFFRTKTAGRIGLLVGIGINLALLFYFKYFDFFIENINYLFQTDFNLKHILLPLGISFFTFQQLSFIIDRCTGKAEHYSFTNYAAFVTFFPQLIAGPIVLYKELIPQFDDPEKQKFHADNFAKGISLFVLGLGKKVLLADTLALVTNFGFEQTYFLDAPSTLLVILSYTFQIYFDFSGYSDMAIGLGKMFGFTFRENFNYPYISSSMQEFWRRWHISVSTWFKEYLYIPLGGNRKGKFRTALNKLAVFFCTGLWHGASLNFIIWGLINGGFMMLESYKLINTEKWLKPLRHIYTMLVTILAFVFFRADTLGDACRFIGHMFNPTGGTSEKNAMFLSQITPVYVIMFAAAIIFSMPVWHTLRSKVKSKELLLYGETGSYVISLVLLAMCIITLSSASYNPFIYFRF